MILNLRDILLDTRSLWYLSGYSIFVISFRILGSPGYSIFQDLYDIFQDTQYLWYHPGYSIFVISSRILNLCDMFQDTWSVWYLSGYSIFVISGELPGCEANDLLMVMAAVQTVKPQLLSEVTDTGSFCVGTSTSTVDTGVQRALDVADEEDQLQEAILQAAIHLSMQGESTTAHTGHSSGTRRFFPAYLTPTHSLVTLITLTVYLRNAFFWEALRNTWMAPSYGLPSDVENWNEIGSQLPHRAHISRASCLKNPAEPNDILVFSARICSLVSMLRTGGATYTILKRVRFWCHARWHSSVAFN